MQVPSDIQCYNSRQHHFTGDRGPWLEHLMEDEGLNYEQAMAALAGWEFIPFVDPEFGHMATLIKKNREVHFAAYAKFRHKAQVTSERIKGFLQPILDKEIYLVTKVAPDDDSRFIERLGFQELGSTIDGIRSFILNEIQYPKVRTCTH